MQRDICIDRIRQRASHHKDEPAYFSRINSKWQSINWHDCHNQIRAFAKAIMAVGFEKNDKLSILGFNRLEWVVSCIGAQYANGVSVGVYTSSSKEEVSYVVDHSDSKILVVENLDRYEKQVKPIRTSLSKVQAIVLMSDDQCNDEGVFGYKEFLAKGEKISDEALDERQEQIDPKSVATMIYTSGTTGNPKSVMLSHASVAWTVRSAVQSWRCGTWDRSISYLPLAHVAEQMFTIYAPIDCGIHCHFASSFEEFKDNLLEIEPTVFFGVPRVYEKIYEGVKDGLSKKSGLAKAVIGHFSKVTHNYYRAIHQGKLPNLLTNAQYQFAHKKLFSKLREKIGFSKTRLCMSGAAPISKEILDFFCGLDIPIYEVYGQSENSGPATYNVAGKTKIGSVGRPIPGGEISIAEDGEILIKGPHVFLGYYKNDEATKEVLKDGWLYSGDIGTLDQNGFLHITDRKKDLLITAGGKNISPQNLESMLKNLSYVQSAVVVGDSKKYLCALLSPDIESMKKKAKDYGIEEKEALKLVEHEEVHRLIKEELAKVNSRLAPVEQIKRYSLLHNEFSIETGEFTPTMKVKRKFVNQKYQDQISSMYQ